MACFLRWLLVVAALSVLVHGRRRPLVKWNLLSCTCAPQGWVLARSLVLESVWCLMQQRGACGSTVGNLLCALQFHLPAWQQEVNEPWKLSGTWGRTEMPTRALPLPARVTRTFASYALRLF
eukprot:3088624-Amphidinium_carterae.3